MRKIAALIVLLFFISGCTGVEYEVADFAKDASKEVVNLAVDRLNETISGAEQAYTLCKGFCDNSTLNLSDGPCLSEKVVEDWVCDVAHEPRQEVDNLEENQCESFGEEAHHFVELDENCKLIKIR